jgi:hypothetical protein
MHGGNTEAIFENVNKKSEIKKKKKKNPSSTVTNA